MSRAVETIDQVIERLGEIIDWAAHNNSRAGYFAALYRRVTVEVKQGIDDGFFEDGPRMKRLDVIFANRYLEAFDQWRGDGERTAVWRYAFAATDQFWPIVLQHLLLGMNAHINLDLGIAAARTVLAPELPSLRTDFNRINTILFGLVSDVQTELAEVWPPLRIFNRFLGTADDKIINFSMQRARDHAWSVAEQLAPLTEAGQAQPIAMLDAGIVRVARLVRHPGLKFGLVTKAVRLGERTTISETIRILS